MNAVPAPDQCPIGHATSARDYIECEISITDEISSMVAGIHAMAELPLDGVTLAQLKKRVNSLNSLALLTVRFADGCSARLGKFRGQAQGILDGYLSECWMPAVPGAMPPYEQAVIVWDNLRGKPEAVVLDPDVDCWVSLDSGSRTDTRVVTHWRHCHAPDGIAGEGSAPSASVVVNAPYSQVHIQASDAYDNNIMRARQLAAVLRVMPIGDYSEQMVLLLRQMADDLVKELKVGNGAALLVSQMTGLLLTIQWKDGPCDLLWLCQQIANEIDVTIAVVPSSGVES